ncbi:MAG TPA: dethiobiotin synthase [Solirubrobacteraceae bacterium]|nr:dethiobiotin synthase [Solirubrobacteraceae bacterium]
MGELLFITGTDTGVGKTIATAALVCGYTASGRSVAVYKPTQAGLEDGQGDSDTVARLAGLESVFEGIRLALPMAPVFAARREGVALPTAADHAARIAELCGAFDVVCVEGAGGLLVALDEAGATLVDIAAATAHPGRFIVVCRAALGSLNHTALTLEALARRGAPVAGLVIGAWPAAPDEIDTDNRAHFGALDVSLLGAIPAGAGALDPADFRAQAPTWLAPPVSA